MNPDVATVSDNGVVTAVGAGETTIRAYIDDETYAICAVTVKRPTIALNTTRIEIAVGESFLLTANPDPFTSRLYWNSHDSSIASVSSGGNVTGVAPGETYITIRASTGVITFCFVTVIEQQISISGESSVREGESITLSVTKRPTDWNVVWTSSDPSIATVSQTGEVTGVKAGTVTITATMEGGPSAAYTIYVTIPDGVYYLHFPYEITNYYLQALYLKNNVSNELILHSKASDNDPTTTRIAQMWRITHIGVGQYTIRPINNLDMCLGVNSNIENGYRYVANYFEEADSLEDVPLNAQWTIMWMDDGYVLLAYGSTNRALTTFGGIQAQNVSVVVDTYSDVESSFRWTLTPVTRVPTGLALYDKTTGLPADTMPCTYVAPDEMRNLRLLNYEMFFFPDKSLSNTIKYIVGNQNLASINDNGEITGISPGTTNVFVYLHCGDSTEVLEFPLTVTGISNGTYFLRNKTTGYYADIHSQIMENGRTIHQWEPHGGITQSWIFTHLGDGTYTIQSAKYTVNSSTKYYLGVSGDSSTVDQPVVLRTGSITSGMKWVVEPTTDGAFKLIPKSGEAAGCVLATTTSDATNGAILIQGKYIDNNSYRDEWLLCTVCTVYTLSLNIYYDYAFAVRHPTAETLLNSFQPQINNILGKVFGICLTWNTPQKIHSTPDYCKLYSGIGIYTNTVNCICPANPSLDVPGCNYYNVNQNKHANNPMSQYFPCENCTSWYQIYHDFIKDYPGNDLTTSVLFTGSALYNDNGVQCNRSYRWYNNGLLLQNISSSTADYYKDVFSTLVHEISHDIGAIDHYHEILEDEQGNKYCRGGANCYRCNEETGRPMWCIMDQGTITDPANVDTDNLYCSACLEEIFEHLSSHHKN